MIRGKAFHAVKRRAMRNWFIASQDKRYEKSIPILRATVVNDNFVSQTGRLLPFDNRSNLTIFPGKEIRVTNVGRPSAALYVPARNAETE